VNDFRGGFAGDGPVQLVLHGLEKVDTDLKGGVIIDAGGINIGDLLVKPPLRGSDVLDRRSSSSK